MSGILFKNNKPSDNFGQLLDLFEIDHNSTLTGVHQALQEKWYQAGKLRAEITEGQAHKRDASMKLFEALGMVASAPARNDHYSHSLLLGATETAVTKRLDHIASEWNRGVRFQMMSLLGSTRSMIDGKERKEFRDEAEMMRAIYEEKRNGFPWSVQPSVLKAKPSPGKKHAGTAETLELWNRNAAPGTVLLVSSQPFVEYQRLVAEEVMPNRSIDATGYAAPGSTPVTTYLDNIAKMVFQLKILEARKG
jgi:hypothetical protein